MPEPEKKLIEVTVEKRLRYAKRLRLQKKKLNFLDEEMEHGDIEWDFAAADEYGRTIIGWD